MKYLDVSKSILFSAVVVQFVDILIAKFVTDMGCFFKINNFQTTQCAYKCQIFLKFTYIILGHSLRILNSKRLIFFPLWGQFKRIVVGAVIISPVLVGY